MKVICAWCEQEGKETLLGEPELYDGPLPSHGICHDHQRAILQQIRRQRTPGSPRRRGRGPTRTHADAGVAARQVRRAAGQRRSRPVAPLLSTQLYLPFET